jgi:hypothetical protein
MAMVPTEYIVQAIRVIRGQKVLLDADLAALYGVETKRFNEQVKRNRARFPEDFMFQLTEEEFAALRSHNATSNTRRGGRRYLPYAFTEHGTIMAATILNSPWATEVSVYVVRAFIQLRELLASQQALAQRLEAVEDTLTEHDAAIRELLKAIRQFMAPPDKPKRRIGFIQED